jgi:hypothetical protein
VSLWGWVTIDAEAAVALGVLMSPWLADRKVLSQVLLRALKSVHFQH